MKKKKIELKEKKKKLMNLIKDGNPILGNLAGVYLPCGKLGCKCNKGFLHGPMWRLTWKNNDKKSCILYVQKGKLKKVKKEVSEYKKAKELLKEIGFLNLSLFREEEKRKK